MNERVWFLVAACAASMFIGAVWMVRLIEAGVVN